MAVFVTPKPSVNCHRQTPAAGVPMKLGELPHSPILRGQHESVDAEGRPGTMGSAESLGGVWKSHANRVTVAPKTFKPYQARRRMPALRLRSFAAAIQRNGSSVGAKEGFLEGFQLVSMRRPMWLGRSKEMHLRASVTRRPSRDCHHFDWRRDEVRRTRESDSRHTGTYLGLSDLCAQGPTAVIRSIHRGRLGALMSWAEEHVTSPSGRGRPLRAGRGERVRGSEALLIDTFRTDRYNNAVQQSIT